MKLLLIPILLLISQCMLAQQDIQVLDLLKFPTKTEGTDFYFKQVSLATTVPNMIGLIEVRGKNKETNLQLPIEKEKHLLDFLNKAFNGNKAGTAITLHITQLEIKPSQPNKTSPSDTFKYHCEFKAMYDGTEETLYSFNAKNAVGSFENPAEVVTNYLIRAITTSVKKFNTEFKQHKDWNTQSKANTGNVIVTCNHNKIKNKLDSLACEKNFKLNENCYSKNLKEDAKGIQTRFMLTYKAEAIESNNKIKLNIETFAFLAKNRSWIASNATDLEKEFIQHQGHYDICYVYGIKLNKALREYPYSMGEFKSEMNKVYNEVYSEYIKLRKEYEDDTKSKPENIGKWQQKIASMSK